MFTKNPPRGSYVRFGKLWSLHGDFKGQYAYRAAKRLADELRGQGYECILDKRKHSRHLVYSNGAKFMLGTKKKTEPAMRPNMLDRYYCDKYGHVFDCEDNNKKQTFYISSTTGHKMMRVYNGKPKKTARSVARLMATLYLPNPKNHHRLFVKVKAIPQLHEMRWCSLKDLKSLERGVEPKPEPVKPKPVRVNNVYPPKPKPVVELNIASNGAWK